MVFLIFWVDIAALEYCPNFCQHNVCNVPGCGLKHAMPEGHIKEAAQKYTGFIPHCFNYAMYGYCKIGPEVRENKRE